MDNATNNLLHKPVMVDEVLDYLHPQPGHIILDCTVGNGGHASRIMSRISPNGLFIGMADMVITIDYQKNIIAKIRG